MINSYGLEGVTDFFKVLQMLVCIFIKTSSKIQLPDQGYEIRADLIPLASMGCDEVASSRYFPSELKNSR
jgi:hypothetical protein